MATKTILERSQQSATQDIELSPIEPNAPPSAPPDDDDNVLNKKNIMKILAAGFSFFFAGANDGSLGALTPYILRTYHVGTEYIALMYFNP